MSVRAYRINKIEQEQQPTFNLWHDTDILDFLETQDNFSVEDYLNQNGSGEFEISVESLKKLLKQKNIKLEDWQKEKIQADIDWAKKKKEEYVLYTSY